MAGQFVILIGGPGTYAECDPHHDKTWLNYLYPMQVAAEKDLYNRGRDQVHWVVYEPAYNVRWLDDSDITFWQDAYETLFSGSALHKLRKQAADKVLSRGAADYVDRIKQLAHSLAITYKGINSPEEFWKYLAAFPPRSIGRTWYSGHAAPDGLILKVTHDNNDRECQARWDPLTGVLTAEIATHAHLKDRFDGSTRQPSRFYGCRTAKFAEAWHTTFGVPTEGAERSITFGRIITDGENVLHGLQTNATDQGAPNWTAF